jgi:hypothetical protein
MRWIPKTFTLDEIIYLSLGDCIHGHATGACQRTAPGRLDSR